MTDLLVEGLHVAEAVMGGDAQSANGGGTGSASPPPGGPSVPSSSSMNAAFVWLNSPGETFYRLTLCIFILTVGFVLSWVLPKFLRWLLRDICHVHPKLSHAQMEHRLSILEDMEFGPRECKSNDIPQVHTSAPQNISLDSKTSVSIPISGIVSLAKPKSLRVGETSPSIYHTPHYTHKSHHHHQHPHNSHHQHQHQHQHQHSLLSEASDGGPNGEENDEPILRRGMVVFEPRRQPWKNCHYCRSNILTLYYIVLQFSICIATITVALWCIDLDLYTVVASLGFLTIVAIFHLGDFFAFIWIVLNNELQEGDIIGIIAEGKLGCVEDIGLRKTTLRCVRVSSGCAHREYYRTNIPNSSIMRNSVDFYYSYWG